MSRFEDAAKGIWEEVQGRRGYRNNDEEEDDEDDGEYEEDSNLRALRRAIPRAYRPMQYEFYFSDESFKGAKLQLWRMTRTREQWDSPPFRADFSVDERIQYAMDLCEFVWLTVDRPEVGRRKLSKSERTHWCMPWLRKFSNTPRAEALYRIVLLAFEMLRRSHFICCQPYNGGSATQFEEERVRVQRVLMLVLYLRSTILPQWKDQDWEKYNGMDCTQAMLASVSQWLRALLYFMLGTKFMNHSRGISGTRKITDDNKTAANSGSAEPALQNTGVNARSLMQKLMDEESGSVSTLVAQTSNAVMGHDEVLNAMQAASAGLQPELLSTDRNGDCKDHIRLAAAFFLSAAQILELQDGTRPVYWTEDERVALAEDQCFEPLTHDVRMRELPTNLNVHRDAPHWHMRALDERAAAWSRMPWPHRIMGLWLRCEGDYFMWLSRHGSLRACADNRVRGAMCHVVALQEFGANVVTYEEVQRSQMDEDQLKKGTRAPGGLKNMGRHGTGVGGASGGGSAVQFDFLGNRTASYMKAYYPQAKGLHDEDADGGVLELPWEVLHRETMNTQPAAKTLAEKQITKEAPEFH